MEHDEFNAWLRRKPFRPFRVIVDDGRTYEVRYPNMNLLASTYVKIGIPAASGGQSPLCDHTEYVRLSQIVRVEPFPEPDQKCAGAFLRGAQSMDHEQFHSFLCHRPFQPFRVFVDDGRTFDVRYPFMTLLNGPYARIGIPGPGPNPVADHSEFVWLSQIVRIEKLPANETSPA